MESKEGCGPGTEVLFDECEPESQFRNRYRLQNGQQHTGQSTSHPIYKPSGELQPDQSSSIRMYYLFKLRHQTAHSSPQLKVLEAIGRHIVCMQRRHHLA